MTLDKINKRTFRRRDSSSINSTGSNCETDAQVTMMMMPDILRIQSIISIVGPRLGHHIIYGDIVGGIASLLLNKTYTKPQESYRFV
jgi:hypothetical protein